MYLNIYKIVDCIIYIYTMLQLDPSLYRRIWLDLLALPFWDRVPKFKQ